ncbi:chloroplastic group IIA intron splicing facilitator CRS1, chloroplastic [Phoenix dactylifera]|uniref:Chloroplastic group IIA intron splicing facilitator CRS1, chloroplastic n=1 Tax=Phoenix dactylifera TaxID=42345 RepID=A0A8B7CET0_PHODC|nr:chloroplastic group IIA intron splicing facilitator CRS1, chloroplastic [Phoenix dactylifera]
MPPSALFFSSLASSKPCPPHRPDNLQSLSPSTAFSSSAKPLNSPPPPLKLIPQDKAQSPLSSEKPPWPLAGAVKMPSAPWMRGPLLLPADQVLDLSNPHKKKPRGEGGDGGRGDDDPARDRSLTDKVRSGRSRQAMRGIIRSITKLQEIHPMEGEENATGEAESPEFSVPLNISDGEARWRPSRRSPWVGVEKKLVFRREKKARQPTAAELTLTGDVLARLRGEARRMKKWVKAKKAGVTQEVVDEIRRTWSKGELAMVKFVEPLRRNMDRAHEILETKTGGLVVWHRRDTLVVHRGSNYSLVPEASHNSAITIGGEASSSKLNLGISEDGGAIPPTKCDEITNISVIQQDGDIENTHTSNMEWEIQNAAEAIKGTLYEREVDRLLDGLGPRFIDWWWRKPLPVDADLLPEFVPNFRPPFRLCPPLMKAKLTDEELTYLRKLAHPLPTHFALGKIRKLQGLAAAIIKLWEKSLIAKIAVKVGIPNINNKQMSCELKRLTGGVLILRNKDFIILYRGKDFLSARVASSIAERETEICGQQLKEELARTNAINLFSDIDEFLYSTGTVGTYTEFQDIQSKYTAVNSGISEEKIQFEAERAKLEKEIRKKERELFIIKRKIEKSEKELAKLNSQWSPSEEAADQELLMEEERQTFRNIGLKMDELLLLGRRGIYDGVIGNIHQHWKHKEVVKVITKQQDFHQITYTAQLLEIESGGILVAIEKLRSTHAIILYRGKNYGRPLKLLPDNLLTKREAFQRSIEIQRRGSLKYFARQRQKSICALKQRVRDLKTRTKKMISRKLQCPNGVGSAGSG